MCSLKEHIFKKIQKTEIAVIGKFPLAVHRRQFSLVLVLFSRRIKRRCLGEKENFHLPSFDGKKSTARLLTAIFLRLLNHLPNLL